MSFGIAPEKREGSAIEYDPGAKRTPPWKAWRMNVAWAWRNRVMRNPFSRRYLDGLSQFFGELTGYPRRRLAKWIAGPDTGW